MQKQLLEILSLIPKVQYADLRIVEKKNQNIETKDGVVEALASSTSLGYGVRVLVTGAWGFAASYDFSRSGIERTIKKAVSIAKESARFKTKNVVLTKQKPIKASYKTPVKEDPFNVPIKDKIKLLLEADRAQRVSPEIVISQSFFSANSEKKWFASTEGSIIDQEIIWTGIGIEASAAGNSDFQNRSYPNSFRGQNQTRGYELVRELKLIENAPKIGEEAVKLLRADLCPTGDFDIILDGNQVALQIHESCGHASELDRVFGYEASYAGTSFLTAEKLANFQYGSKAVNITADATIPGGLGTFGYDDEGVAAERTFLVKNGLFSDYLTSRETATELGEIHPGYKKGSTGAMRASSWDRIPLIRMTNVNLEPGNWKLADLIADTKYGIFMSTNRSWSIDDRRYNFQFGTEIGWEIKNGKLGKMLKNPTYQGITPEFWNRCDAVCDKSHWEVWGTPNCGKGQPQQVMYTGHGASPTRFRKIKVGVVRW